MIDVNPQTHISNLEWMLAGQALLNTKSIQYAPNEQWFSQLNNNYQPHLKFLRSNPIPLIIFLKNTLKSGRLGDYFEVLWRYWFSTNNEYSLLYNNLQVFDNNRTVGEFDFIVLNNSSNKVEHWEVALKFYLKKYKTNLANSWVGPNKIDRLDIKLDKLINSQILLSSNNASIELLDRLNIIIDSKKIILKGRLFYSENPSDIISNNQNPLAILNPEHEHSSWYYYSDFISNEKFSQFQWCTLVKLNWLSNTSHYNAYPLHSKNKLAFDQKPICIAGLQDNMEKLRLFIVPDGW